MKRLAITFGLVASLAACAPQTNISSISTDTQAADVVGGEVVSPKSKIGRSTVGLYEGKLGYICSGTLIAENLILTAAHCVDPKAKDLYAIFATEMKKATKETSRKVETWVIHPKYSQTMKAKDLGDIAIVRIAGKAPAGFQPAPFLWDEIKLQDGVRTQVAGYGLNWTWLVKKGAGTLRTTTLRVSESRYSDTEATLDQSLKKGICSGDSGGPAYLEVNGQLHVWGVASRSDSLPTVLTPKCVILSVFTRVATYHDWILQTMSQLTQ